MTITILMAAMFGAFVCLFLAFGSLVTDTGRSRGHKSDGVQEQLTAARQELTVPFADRIFKPSIVLLSRIARRISPQGLVRGVKRRLILAGSPMGLDVDLFMAMKATASLAAFVLVGVVLIMTPINLSRTLVGAILGAAAFFIPDLWLRGKINDRKKAIRVALPDTLDLLTISVEAGLGFDSALSRVVANTSGPLSDEFFRMLQEIRLGTPRAQAFRNLGKRTGVGELDSFIVAMLQADVFGISIGKVLRVQAHEMRTKRRQRAEEAAMKTPVKIVFPLVLCIFPALLVILLGPAVINIYKAMIGAF
jgi:tight adherence protein C